MSIRPSSSQVRQTVLSRQHRRQMESQRSWTCSSLPPVLTLLWPPVTRFFFFFLLLQPPSKVEREKKKKKTKKMLYSTYRQYFHRDLLFVLVISLFYRTGLLLLPGCVYLCVCSTELRRPISDVIWQLGLRKRRVNICPLLPLSFVLFFAFLWLSIVPKKKKKHRDDERSQCVIVYTTGRSCHQTDWYYY